MLKIDLRKVLAEFGEALGLELAFDDNGVCVLTLDEDTPIAIRAMEEDSSMTLSCAVREELHEHVPCRLAHNQHCLRICLKEHA